ncbi:MAG: hypothetical protein FJ280_06830 [Planctomycetes bacterium]|nr:hypothetical protein [Planctomycetota bacterium]
MIRERRLPLAACNGLGFLVAFIAMCGVVHAEVVVVQSGRILAMENDVVRFEYDLSTGRYVAIDRRDRSICIKEGVFQANDLTTAAPGLEHRWQSKALSDELGDGKTILIESGRPGQVTLLFQVTVYEDRGCIVLAGGIENRTDHPVQLKVIKPVSEAILFNGFSMADNFRLVDGYSGGEPLEWGVRAYSPVHKGNYIPSRNNVLMTFGEQQTRRSLVMGGLTYHDFEKFATIGQPRRVELAADRDGNSSLVCYLNLPDDTADTGPAGESLRLRQGPGRRQFSYRALWGDELATAAAGEEGVDVEAANLNADCTYHLGFSWWHTDSEDRIQSVAVESGNGEIRHVLLDGQRLPMWSKQRKDDPQHVERVLPREVYNSGSIRIQFRSRTDNPRAIVNEVWLREGPVPLLDKNLTSVNAGPRPRRAMTGSLYAEDPVGKRVDPGVRYLPDDRFYVDFITSNPFENLEQYGRAIRAAQQIELNMYDFPTVCLWYAHHGGYGGGQAKNDTVGAVAEMENIRRSGFLEFSRAAVRLVPDCYTKDNQQGWWDDEHFQKHGSTNLGDFTGGTYKPPYETSEKWGKAVIERGGIPLTYCQTSFRSEDYAFAFPEHMLFNNATAWRHESYRRPADDNEFWGNAWLKNFRLWGYDYTDPGFIEHMRKVYAAYRAGGIKGLMFDYPVTGWAAAGGLEDAYATTASAYRNIFRLAKEGLGPECYIHERNMERGSDITLGLVASQRTENDTARISPDVVTRCGLRWYKNRVVVNYDADSKNVWRLRENRDAVRSLLTMSYVTTGRLLLANSFAQLSPEIIHDLTRIYPFHTTPKSARPVDALTERYPRVYDFEVSPDWHQLTFYNPNAADARDIAVSLAGDTAEGALGLDPGKRYYVYDFWNDAFVGELSGAGSLTQRLRPGEARMMSVHEAVDHPQCISTNRHVMQGYLDLVRTEWLAGRNLLRGISRITGGDSYAVTIATNGHNVRGVTVNDPDTLTELTTVGHGLVKLTLTKAESAIVQWTVGF